MNIKKKEMNIYDFLVLICNSLLNPTVIFLNVKSSVNFPDHKLIHLCIWKFCYYQLISQYSGFPWSTQFFLYLICGLLSEFWFSSRLWLSSNFLNDLTHFYKFQPTLIGWWFCNLRNYIFSLDSVLNVKPSYPYFFRDIFRWAHNASPSINTKLN